LKNYRVVTGFIRFQDYDEFGVPKGVEQELPYAPMHIVAVDLTMAKYIASRFNLVQYKVELETSKPQFLKYELN
jgi:hypothetical protein